MTNTTDKSLKKLRIGFDHDYLFPPKNYAGVERIIYWLAKSLAKQGHEVFVKALEGSVIPGCTVEPNSLPNDLDILHLHTLKKLPKYHRYSRPWLFTHHGTDTTKTAFSKISLFLRNMSYVSQRHAKIHGSTQYCLNGIDPIEYPLYKNKLGYYVWMGALGHGENKGLFSTIDLAIKHKFNLKIVGPGPENLDYVLSVAQKYPNVEYLGVVDGEDKLNLLGQAKALLFLINWEDPCPLVPIEAIFLGTPVITKSIGAMPEIINQDCGVFCDDLNNFQLAVETINILDPKIIRESAMTRFNQERMANDYVRLYLEHIDSWKIQGFSESLLMKGLNNIWILRLFKLMNYFQTNSNK